MSKSKSREVVSRAVDDALNQRYERQAMTTFKATTEGTDKLGLRAVLERYDNDQWLPDDYDQEQCAVMISAVPTDLLIFGANRSI